MRGFGQSAHSGPHYWFADYIADLDALLDALSPAQPLALVGHSMGAQIASLYAGIRPERISQLVILDGLFLPDTPSDQAPKRYRSWLHQLQDPPQARVYADFHSLATRIQKQHPSLSAPRALDVAKAWAGKSTVVSSFAWIRAIGCAGHCCFVLLNRWRSGSRSRHRRSSWMAASPLLPKPSITPSAMTAAPAFGAATTE